MTSSNNAIGIPRYMQVSAAMRRRIESGRWPANERIPSLPELQQEFGVARVTVRRAIEILNVEGLLQPVQGAGTFVSPVLRDKRWLRLDLRWDAIASYIGTNIPQFLQWETDQLPPSSVVADNRRAESYYRLVSRQLRDGSPFSFANAFVAREIVERDMEAFRRQPALAVIAAMDDLNVRSARQSFVIGAADATIAEHLDIGMGFPTAEAHVEVESQSGRVIYVGDIVYRGDCVRLDIDLLR